MWINKKIPIYGIMIIISLLSNIIVVKKESKEYNYNKDEISSMLIYENIGIIVGAKLYTYLTNYNTLKNTPFIKIGLSSLGAGIGAILMVILFAIQFKKNKKELLQIITPSLPLMYGIGKIGCFIAGCCHGIKYKGIGSIIYNYPQVASSETSYFPIQLIEAIVFITIFIITINLEKNTKDPYKIVGINFTLCGILKFLLDFLRDSHKNIILSTNQIICIIIIIIGIFIIKQKKLQQ